MVGGVQLVTQKTHAAPLSRGPIPREGVGQGGRTLPLLAVGDGSCSSVNEVSQGVDDHEGLQN